MKIDIKSAKTGMPRNFNIDLIKAICISLVLIWHLEPFDISIPNITAYSANLIFKEAQIALYFQLTLIAVPAFLLTSQYLYIQKLEEHGYPYFFKRLGYLILIDFFWISCQTVVYYSLVTVKSALGIAAILPSGPGAWLGFIMIGGPSLPIVGASVFYYLGILIILTTFSTLFALGSRYKWFEIILGWLVIIGSLIYFQIRSLDGVEISSSSIENFALYTPMAYFLHKYGSRLKFTSLSTIWIGYLVFSGGDIILRLAGVPFNVYGRLSIVFGAVALVSSLINRTNTREIKLVSFLSVHSLGIFALHKYFEYYSTLQMTPLFALYSIRKKLPVWEMRINFQLPSIAILTVLLTLASVYVLGKTPLKRFIR